MVVVMISVVSIALAAAAIFAKREGGWFALAFAVMPCVAVLAAWAWALRHGGWGTAG
jgi:hypothetical protein